MNVIMKLESEIIDTSLNFKETIAITEMIGRYKNPRTRLQLVRGSS